MIWIIDIGRIVCLKSFYGNSTIYTHDESPFEYTAQKPFCRQFLRAGLLWDQHKIHLLKATQLSCSMLYDMLICMMIGNAHLWILRVPEKYSYYSKQANKANKSQSDYVETRLFPKVKKGNLYNFCKRGTNEQRIQEQKQKGILFSLLCQWKSSNDNKWCFV